MRHFIEPNSFSLAEQLALLDLADRMEADPSVLPPSRSMADSKERRVRVLGS